MKESNDSRADGAAEARLIHAVQDGSHEKYRHLVRAHQGMIFRLIMRQVGDRAAAEDLAQEVFIKAFYSIKRFRADARFSSWLARIALNHTNSYFSSRRYRQNACTSGYSRRDFKDSGDEELAAEQRQLIEQIRLRLPLLKPRFREALVLCGLEGRSYEEAAEILRVPVGTVRSRLNKARLLLKEMLKDFFEEEA